MTEIIKKHWDKSLFLGIGLVILTISILGISGINPMPAEATTVTTTVSVTATVQKWITISVNNGSVTLSPDLINTVGNMNVGSSTSIVTTVGTNSSGGYSLSISGLRGGLATGTFLGADLIASVGIGTNASTAIATGTDSYGAQATSTLVAVAVNARYDKWSTAILTVGAIASSTSQVISNTTAAGTSSTTVKIFATVDSAQVADGYADTVTLTALTLP